MNENQQEVAKFYSTFLTLLIATAFTIVVLFLTINQTLRARLLAENSLQLASEEIKGLYNDAPCGYHSVDAGGTIIEMNKTWLTWIGYQREQVINKMTLMDVLTENSKENYRNTFPLLKTQGFYHLREKFHFVAPQNLYTVNTASQDSIILNQVIQDNKMISCAIDFVSVKI